MRQLAWSKKPCVISKVGRSWCLRAHVAAHVHASTQMLYIAVSGPMFSQTQQASSYCIMLRIWKGFSSSYGRTQLILLNLTGESLPLGKDQRARALAVLPVPLLLACTHGREALVTPEA